MEPGCQGLPAVQSSRFKGFNGLKDETRSMRDEIRPEATVRKEG
jgi:hypothetical protein